MNRMRNKIHISVIYRTPFAFKVRYHIRVKGCSWGTQETSVTTLICDKIDF